MADRQTSIETPCLQVCVLDPGRNVCIGCGRTLDEIARWIALGDGERRRIMAQLPERLAALRNAAAAAATA